MATLPSSVRARRPGAAVRKTRPRAQDARHDRLRGGRATFRRFGQKRESRSPMRLHARIPSPMPRSATASRFGGGQGHPEAGRRAPCAGGQAVPRSSFPRTRHISWRLACSSPNGRGRRIHRKENMLSCTREPCCARPKHQNSRSARPYLVSPAARGQRRRSHWWAVPLVLVLQNEAANAAMQRRRQRRHGRLSQSVVSSLHGTGSAGRGKTGRRSTPRGVRTTLHPLCSPPRRLPLAAFSRSSCFGVLTPSSGYNLCRERICCAAPSWIGPGGRVYQQGLLGLAHLQTKTLSSIGGQHSESTFSDVPCFLYFSLKKALRKRGPTAVRGILHPDLDMTSTSAHRSPSPCFLTRLDATSSPREVARTVLWRAWGSSAVRRCSWGKGGSRNTRGSL